MKNSSIKKIELGFSCNQDFNSMTTSEGGRHCTSCDKLVVDFTAFSNQEILQYFENYQSNKTCGRFSAEQLPSVNRQLRLNQTSKAKKLVASLATTAVLSATSLSAQQEIIDQPPLHIEVLKKSGVPNDSTFVLKGQVVDSYSNEPLLFVPVVIENTRYKTETDLDGNFEIVVNRTFDLNSKLVASYTGFDTQEITIVDFVKNGGKITLEEGQWLLGDVVIIEKAPIHKRVWGRIKNIFRKN